MNTRIILILMASLIQGCTKLDDYMLGKDNTPKPKALKEVNTKLKVTQNWAIPTGKSHHSDDYLKLRPVIRGNSIYTADTSGLVQSIDKSSGKANWSLQLKHGIISGPTVSHGLVAVSTNGSTVVLIGQNEGKVHWEAKVSGDVLSPPTISHHKVFAKTIDGKVFAFDVASGKQVWMAEHGSPGLVLKASSSPIVVGHLILIGYSDGKLDALDIDSGNVVWQKSIAFATGSSDVERLIDIDADPIVKNNIAYIASYQGYIGAMSLTDGQFLWKKPGSVYKNMVMKNNTLYFTDSHDVLWSIDSKTGQVNWKQTAFKARGLTEPVLMGKDLAVGDKTGYIHVIDSQTGEVIGRMQLSGGVAISPNASGNDIYVVTQNGMLNKLSVG